MTLRLLTTQCLPTLTLARSPLMMQSFMTIVCGERHSLSRAREGQQLTAMFCCSSSPFHWVQCSGFHTAQTVCSLCCQKPAKNAFSIFTLTEQMTHTDEYEYDEYLDVWRKMLSVILRGRAKRTMTISNISCLTHTLPFQYILLCCTEFQIIPYRCICEAINVNDLFEEDVTSRTLSWSCWV